MANYSDRSKKMTHLHVVVLLFLSCLLSINAYIQKAIITPSSSTSSDVNTYPNVLPSEKLSVINNEWKVMMDSNMDYAMKLGIDRTGWGIYQGNYPKTLRITLYGSIVKGNLLIAFADDTQKFFAMNINAHSNMITPTCGDESDTSTTYQYWNGGIVELMSSQEGTNATLRSPFCKLAATNPWDNSCGSKVEMKPISTNDNEWPLTFELNWSTQYILNMRYTPNTGSSQSCWFMQDGFDITKSMNMYISGANIGAEFIISKIDIEWSYDDGFPDSYVLER